MWYGHSVLRRLLALTHRAKKLLGLGSRSAWGQEAARAAKSLRYSRSRFNRALSSKVAWYGPRGPAGPRGLRESSSGTLLGACVSSGFLARTANPGACITTG